MSLDHEPSPIQVGRFEPCRLVRLPEFADSRGSLSAIEVGETIPFDLKRVYYLYDLTAGTSRGGHAHRDLHQLLLALNGSFDVTVDDGFSQTRFTLDHPSTGLYIGPMIWRNLLNFSPDAIGLVLASEHYDEADYFRNYDDFITNARSLA